MSEILKLLIKHFKGDLDRAGKWLETENPNLGTFRPIDLIAMDRCNKLLAFIKSAMEENSRD